VLYEEGFDFSAPNHGHGLHAGERWKKGVAGHRPKGDDWFTVQVEHLINPLTGDSAHYTYSYFYGMDMDCRDPAGKCWGDHLPCMVSQKYYCKDPDNLPRRHQRPLVTDLWYCIELMVDAGIAVSSYAKANGSINFWVDDEQLGPWNNLWLRTDAKVQLNHFWLGLFHHAEHSEAGMRFDNIVVSSDRIGCL
jgi:hypothetical protein